MSEWREGEYLVSTSPDRVDLGVVHGFLEGSYWARGIPLEIVRRSIEHSLNFSLWHEPPGGAPRQVGFARVITDYATFAYIGDVFVLEAHRGRGLSKWLMRVIREHPDLQGFRLWVLLTRDAHGLYRQTGFGPLASPERYMERRTPDAYRKPGARADRGEQPPDG
jgi:GNAT superfamily N-acetyltransferase